VQHEDVWQSDEVRRFPSAAAAYQLRFVLDGLEPFSVLFGFEFKQLC
jgi:hypothetical protein